MTRTALAAFALFLALPVPAAATTTTVPPTTATTTSTTASSSTTSSTTTTVPATTLPFAPRVPSLPSLPFAPQTIAPTKLPLLARTPRSYTSDDAMVRVVQRALGFWGFRVTVDGWYGPRTEQRIRAFQKRSGIPVTGTTTTATWRALGIRPA